MRTLEQGLRELRVSPIGQAGKPPGLTRAVCPRCVCERWVDSAGRFAYHHDDNGAWCNGSREAVRT